MGVAIESQVGPVKTCFESPVFIALSAVPYLGSGISFLALKSIDHILRSTTLLPWNRLELYQIKRDFLISSMTRRLVSVSLLVGFIAAGVFTAPELPLFWILYDSLLYLWDCHDLGEANGFIDGFIKGYRESS